MKIIAEIGSNWKTTDLDAEWLNTADYVKFQIWDTKSFIHPSHPGYARFEQTQIPDAMRETLVAKFGPRLMASVFDEHTADVMHELGLTNWKIASGDITHTRLIKHIARYNQPMWISTGNANHYEIKHAISTIREVNIKPIVVMHCISRYPCGLGDLALKRVEWLKKLVVGKPDLDGSVVLGWSSHMNAVDAVAAASVMATLGATCMEFHTGTANGPDKCVTLPPKLFKNVVSTVRTISRSNNDIDINEGELLWARRCETDWLRPWIRG